MDHRYEVWEGDYLLRRFYDRDNALIFMESRPNTKLVKLDKTYKKFSQDYFTEQYGEPPF